MVALSPMIFDDLYLKPAGGKWVCCKAEESAWPFEVQAYVSASDTGPDGAGFPSYDWSIKEVLAQIHAGEGRYRYTALEGDALEDVRQWLETHERDRIDIHVSHNFMEASSGERSDLRRAG